MKNITIAGNVTKDSTIRHTQDGTAVLGFSVAVNDRKKNTTFFEVSMFGNRGKALEPYVKKGTFVTVSGDFQTREYEGKTYLMVNANELTLGGSKPKADTRQSGYDMEADAQLAHEPTNAPDMMEDEIPF